MVAGSTASAKAKARIHQQETAQKIRGALNLPDEDVVSVPMGSPGIDIMLSEKARAVFPYAVECKRTEKLSIPAWWEQCTTNAEKEGLKPMLVYRQSRKPAMVVMEFDDLMELMKRERPDMGFI